VIVKLQLKGPLKKYGREADTFKMQIESSEISVSDLLELLTIPASSVSFILVDGEKAGSDAVLKGGETVTVNPRIAGG